MCSVLTAVVAGQASHEGSIDLTILRHYCVIHRSGGSAFDRRDPHDPARTFPRETTRASVRAPKAVSDFLATVPEAVQDVRRAFVDRSPLGGYDTLCVRVGAPGAPRSVVGQERWYVSTFCIDISLYRFGVGCLSRTIDRLSAPGTTRARDPLRHTCGRSHA